MFDIIAVNELKKRCRYWDPIYSPVFTGSISFSVPEHWVIVEMKNDLVQVISLGKTRTEDSKNIVKKYKKILILGCP
jgi:hypothetical protein